MEILTSESFITTLKTPSNLKSCLSYLEQGRLPLDQNEARRQSC